MTHVIQPQKANEMGLRCSCGKRFPVPKAATEHAQLENAAEEAKARLEPTEADTTPAQYKTAEKDVKAATTPEPAAEAPKPKPSAQKVEAATETKAEIKEKIDKSTGEITSQERRDIAPAEDKGEKQMDFAELSPFDQSRLQVQKYATSIVGGDWGNQFMLNLTALARDDNRIARCTPESIVKALKACIDARLMPNTYAQHAMVAPYWSSKKNTFELQFQLMKNGLIELARRSGEVKTLNVELVYEGDEFDIEYGTERKLHHKPNFDVDRTDASKVKYAYMTAVLANGERPFEVVTKSELDKIKRIATAGKKGSPWDDWEPEMQKKTALKRGAKLLPSSPEMQKAIQYDSLEEAGKLAITAGGELVDIEQTGQVAVEVEHAINAAESREDLNKVLQSLSVADRKKATGLVQIRMRELA